MSAINANIEQFELVELFGKPTQVLFTCLRVDRATVPDGMYVNAVRHDDEGNGEPCEIAQRVVVMHILEVDIFIYECDPPLNGFEIED